MDMLQVVYKILIVSNHMIPVSWLPDIHLMINKIMIFIIHGKVPFNSFHYPGKIRRAGF